MEDYEQAAEEFKTLVESKGLKFFVQKLPEYRASNTFMLPFSVVIGKGTGQGFGALGFTTCIHTLWTCGEGVARNWAADLDDKALRKVVFSYAPQLKWWRKVLRFQKSSLTLAEAEILTAARKHYRPSIVDVMHSLVLDAMYLDDPVEFGNLFSDSGKAIQVWEQVKLNGPKVQSIFGSDWQKALDLTGRM